MIRLATARIFSGPAMLLPPYFCTTMPPASAAVVVPCSLMPHRLRQEPPGRQLRQAPARENVRRHGARLYIPGVLR